MTGPTDATSHPGRKRGTEERGLPASIPLGHWRGVEVEAHWSVLVAVGLFATLLATGTLPGAHPGDTRTAYWLVAVGTAVVFFLTLLAHELAHALVARAYGMQVKRITLWMLGGVTQLGGPSPTARADALVALAGPAVSLGIGAVSAILAAMVGTSGLVGTALVWLASVSVLLAVFNLLPGAPLDGGRVLRALLWWRYQDRDRAAMVAARAGRLLGYILIVVGLLNVLAGIAAGLWLALVGWFILSGANAEQSAAGDEHLTGLTAADVMTPTSVLAPAWWTVEQFVAQLSPTRITAGVFPVADLNGHTDGVVTLADLEVVPAKHRVDTQLGALAARRVSPVIVTPDVDAAEVAAQIRLAGGIAVVERAGRPIGVITAQELSRAAHLSILGWRTAPPDRR
jgi:Zn-dependent protease/CBS domain-containing protein